MTKQVKTRKSYPVTPLGWSQYYQERFNKGIEEAATAAMWYLFLHLFYESEAEEANAARKNAASKSPQSYLL
jgi:hypothetical protein